MHNHAGAGVCGVRIGRTTRRTCKNLETFPRLASITREEALVDWVIGEIPRLPAIKAGFVYVVQCIQRLADFSNMF
jgi:hypothetical protein